MALIFWLKVLRFLRNDENETWMESPGNTMRLPHLHMACDVSLSVSPRCKVVEAESWSSSAATLEKTGQRTRWAQRKMTWCDSIKEPLDLLSITSPSLPLHHNLVPHLPRETTIYRNFISCPNFHLIFTDAFRSKRESDAKWLWESVYQFFILAPVALIS